jgi:beta-galactosidase
VNTFGEGKAHYVASRNDARFHADFYGRLIRGLGLRRALGADLPDGVTAQVRTDGTREFVFVLGFNRERVDIDLGSAVYEDGLTGEPVSGTLSLPAYTVRVLKRPSGPCA